MIGAVSSGLLEAVSTGKNILQGGLAMDSQIGDAMASISGGSRIQPPASPGQIYNRSSTVTNNGPSISYSPTYNSPAPPPALSFSVLNALGCYRLGCS